MSFKRKVPLHKKIIMWALTYKCNAACEYCYLKNYDQPFKDADEKGCVDIAKKLANDNTFKPDAVWLTGGEPTVLPFLPKIVRIFKNAGIAVVINTNSIINDDKLVALLAERPDGINISLDSVLESKMKLEDKRSFTSDAVIERIKFIVAHKSPDTVVGTAVVLTEESIEGLCEYAKEVESIGVEYISLNPKSGDIRFESRRAGLLLKEKIKKIKSEGRIRLPDDFYLDLICNWYTDGLKNATLSCPAFENFFFVAPWGRMYPCSNECWHSQQALSFELLSSRHWYDEFCKYKNTLSGWGKTTDSECFGGRCIGCWKLYFDSVFTGELKYEK